MSFARILRDFAAAAEVGDGASFAALFTEDGVYHDAFYGPFSGRAAIADMLSGLFLIAGLAGMALWALGRKDRGK